MLDARNSYQALYRQQLCVRRYPETDVVGFLSQLNSPRVILELGCGTGRHLLPMLQYCRSSGLVVGSELAQSGIDQIGQWIASMGGRELRMEQLGEEDRLLVQTVMQNPQDLRFFRVWRQAGVAQLGPLGIRFQQENLTDQVLLALDHRDMLDPGIKPGSVEAIVNRGNLMYLPTDKIQAGVNVMLELLTRGGRAFFSLKSTQDGRFARQSKLPEDPWRVLQTGGAQDGLEMSFHDEVRLKTLLEGFSVKGLTHVVSENVLTGNSLADWVVVLEK